MRNFITIPLLTAVLAVAGSFSIYISSATAGSTGLASIHILTRQGKKLCMAGHFHYGADSSSKSKAHAFKNAQRKWADFVILEYGSDWGRFSLATNKGIKCSGKSNGYYCSVEASPCKLLGPRVRTKQYAKKRIKRHIKRNRYSISGSNRRRR